MKSKQCTVIIPPNIQAMMTGAFRLDISAHEAMLYYTDGSIEAADRAVIDKLGSDATWFQIVGAIQAMLAVS